jgi:hypothetical protein
VGQDLTSINAKLDQLLHEEDASACSNALALADALYRQARAYQGALTWNIRDLKRIASNLGIDVPDALSHPDTVQGQQYAQFIAEFTRKDEELRSQEIKDFLQEVPQMEQVAAQVYTRLEKQAPEVNPLTTEAYVARARSQWFAGSMAYEMVGDYLRDLAHQLCPVGKK